MSTLHIHIYFKATRGTDRGAFRKINSKISYSKGSNFFLEYIDNFNISYDSIDKHYYYDHFVPIEISDLDKLILNIKILKLDNNNMLEFINNNITNKLSRYLSICDNYLEQLYYPGNDNFEILKNFILFYVQL